jgi:hypothetical protein
MSLNQRNQANYFMSGRYALEYSLLVLTKNYKGFEKIYLPNIICEEVVTIIQKLGIKIEYYRINNKLEIDFKMLKNSLTDKLSVILVVNYFGFPSQWKELLQIKEKTNCLIIEDNTHSLYSSLNNKDLGTYGDISFNSFRKILPLLSGSQLISNSKKIIFENKKESRLPNIHEILYSLRGLKKLFMKRQLNKKTLQGNTYIKPQPIDVFSKRILDGYDFDRNSIKDFRIKNYRFWYSYLTGRDLSFFKGQDLNEEICPYVFACYADNDLIVNKWIKWGAEKNINIISWPKYHASTAPFLNSDFNRRILCFPVNHQFDLKHIIG